MTNILREFWAKEDGLTSVEYALLLSVIVVAALGTWEGLSTNLVTKLNTVSNAVK